MNCRQCAEPLPAGCTSATFCGGCFSGYLELDSFNLQLSSSFNYSGSLNCVIYAKPSPFRAAKLSPPPLCVGELHFVDMSVQSYLLVFSDQTWLSIYNNWQELIANHPASRHLPWRICADMQLFKFSGQLSPVIASLASIVQLNLHSIGSKFQVSSNIDHRFIEDCRSWNDGACPLPVCNLSARFDWSINFQPGIFHTTYAPTIAGLISDIRVWCAT